MQLAVDPQVVEEEGLQLLEEELLAVVSGQLEVCPGLVFAQELQATLSGEEVEEEPAEVFERHVVSEAWVSPGAESRDQV